MKSAVRYFIKNPVVVNLTLILIILIGLISASTIRSTSEPLPKDRNISITAIYKGASPEEVENGIVDKIEENLEGVRGVRKVTSVSEEGFASINVRIDENADINLVLQDVKDAVEKINTFPEGIEKPIVSKAENLARSYSFAVNGEVSLFQLKDCAKKIKDDLLAIDGISTVRIHGLPEEEIEIALIESEIYTYNITTQEIVKAIQDANIELTGGTIKTSKENVSIRAKSKEHYAKDLENIIVRASGNGGIVYLKDVAIVSNRFSDQTNEKYFNGKPSVTIEVLSRNEENYLDNCDNAETYIQEFNKTNEIIQCEVIDDQSVFLREVLDAMIQNGVLGFLMVLIVLALFLQRKLAFWVALKIPVAFLGMLILGSFYGLTFNMVSIFGFILVLGILVDDGIIIGENIYHHHTNHKKNPVRAALDGTSQMTTPVILSLLTTSVAFSLFFFLPGRVGDMFAEMAFVVIGTLAFALVESFFILPTHIAHALEKPAKPSKFERFFNGALLKFRDKVYEPVFKKAVGKFSWVTVLVFIAILGSSLAMLGTKTVKVGFFPVLDDNFLIANLELSPGTNKNKTYDLLKNVENQVWECNPTLMEIAESSDNIITKTELTIGPKSNEGELKIILKDSDVRGMTSFEVTNLLQDYVAEIPEAVNFTLGGMRANAMFGKPVSIAFYSDDIEELRLVKDELKDALKENKEIRDVVDNDKYGNPEINITLKPIAYHIGLTHGSVMQQIRSLYFGYNIQNLQRNDEEIKVWLRYSENNRSTIEDLENMELNGNNGSRYLLKDVAEIEFKPGVLAIRHNQGKKEIKVEADIASITASAPQILAEIEAEVLPDIMKKYPEVTYEFSGQNEETKDLGSTIAIVGPIILLIILALMIFNGKSFSQAAAILITFPFVLIGVVFGHFFHGATLNMFSILGMIALFGVFVNDALVFTSSLNDNLRTGLKYKDALLETAKTRFRPIVLTSVSTVAGLAPTLFSSSLAVMMMRPPAISIAYGLLFGLLLPLLLLPVILTAMNKFKQLVHRIKTGEKPSAEEVEAAIKQMKVEKAIDSIENSSHQSLSIIRTS